MVALAASKDGDYRQDLDRFLAGREEPAFLTRLRRQGLDRFVQLGFPHPRQEAWRFTDLGPLLATEFRRAGELPVAADRLPPALGDGHRLVFVNGRHAPGLSAVDRLPAGAIVTSLAAALQDHPELVSAYLERLPGLAEHPFSALNTAFLEDGAFVYLPRGVIVEQPLHLVFHAGGRHTVNYPRNLIVLDEGAQATVAEDYCGDGSYCSCPVTELALADGAVCRYHKVQEEHAEAFHLGGLKLRLGRASSADLWLITAGGALNRTDVFALMDGAGAGATLQGLSLVEDGQLADYHVRVEHARPQGTSRQLFKSVLNGRSRTVFDGLIKVVQDAQKTDASQTSRNLLLSRRALAHAIPRLEILADDVKCAHGSTTGFLDEDALFYLRSRGIPEGQARAMLVYGFANELLETVPLAALRERLEIMLAGRFHPDGL